MKPILRLFHILHWVLHMSSYFGDEQERSLVGASRSMQQRKKKKKKISFSNLLDAKHQEMNLNGKFTWNSAKARVVEELFGVGRGQ